MEMNRSTRTHPAQWGLYLDLVQQHPQLRTNHGEPQKMRKLHAMVANRLNTSGKGSSKTVSEWKKCFRHWKSNVRAKARHISEAKSTHRKLSSTELRLLSIFGSTPDDKRSKNTGSRSGGDVDDADDSKSDGGSEDEDLLKESWDGGDDSFAGKAPENNIADVNGGNRLQRFPDRSTRTHPDQWELYLDLVQQHPQLRTNDGEPQKMRQLHAMVATKLNTFGKGSSKSVSEWKKCFSHWKSNVRAKARSISETKNTRRQLSSTEARLLSIFGSTPDDKRIKSADNWSGMGVDDADDSPDADDSRDAGDSPDARNIKSDDDSEVGDLLEESFRGGDDIDWSKVSESNIAVENGDVRSSANNFTNLTNQLGAVAASVGNLVSSNKELLQELVKQNAAQVKQNAEIIQNQQQIIQSLMQLVADRKTS